MTTADWAFIVSLCSVAVSLAGFVWNVWSKFIYPKARLRTSISIVDIIAVGEDTRSLISLGATNYGPTDITLHLAMGRKRPGLLQLRRNKHIAAVNPLTSPDSGRTSGPFSGGLPIKVAIGETFSAYFPIYAAKRWIKAELFKLRILRYFRAFSLVLNGQCAALSKAGLGRSRRHARFRGMILMTGKPRGLAQASPGFP